MASRASRVSLYQMFQDGFCRRVVGAGVQQEAQGRQEAAPARRQQLLQAPLTILVAVDLTFVHQQRHRPE